MRWRLQKPNFLQLWDPITFLSYCCYTWYLGLREKLLDKIPMKLLGKEHFEWYLDLEEPRPLSEFWLVAFIFDAISWNGSYMLYKRCSLKNICQIYQSLLLNQSTYKILHWVVKLTCNTRSVYLQIDTPWHFLVWILREIATKSGFPICV